MKNTSEQSPISPEDELLVALLNIKTANRGFLQDHLDQDNEDKIKELICSFAQKKYQEGELSLLKRMDDHYSLKGGHLLLYEVDGKNVYLNDRVAELKSQLEKKGTVI